MKSRRLLFYNFLILTLFLIFESQSGASQKTDKEAVSGVTMGYSAAFTPPKVSPQPPSAILEKKNSGMISETAPAKHAVSGIIQAFHLETHENRMIFIAILSIISVAAASIFGIHFFLRKGTGKKNSQNRNDDVTEKLTEVIRQLEEKKSGDVKKDIPSQVNETDTEGGMSQLKEEENETAPKHQGSEEPLKDDISILLERLTKLFNEYQETYQNLRQLMADRYKQLQNASKYISEQTERMSKLTLDNPIEIGDEIQMGEHSPKYAEVHELAEQGIDRLEIAQKTGLPVGEVDLLLSLSNQAESED